MPVDGPQVKIFEKNSGISTSFSLKEAKVIRSGNLLLDPPVNVVQWQTQQVPETSFVNYIRDVTTGTGAIARQGSRVKIRYTIFADREFDAPLPGVAKQFALEYTIGRGKADAGLETAVLLMKVGGKRRALIREELLPAISQLLGGVQAESQLAIELELVEAE